MCSISHKSDSRNRRGAVLSLILLCASCITNADITLHIDARQVLHEISPMTFGQHLIYPFESDRLYTSGMIPGLIIDMGTTFLRWPGGTVTTYYHWNQLTGNGWEDVWNPKYDKREDKDPAEYMDADEYIALLRATGAQAMLGINLSSAAEWKTIDAGLEEAESLLNHFKAKGVKVGYIHLDNETYLAGNQHNRDPNGDGKVWTADSYAEHINRYVPLIHAIFPEAKIIANWDSRFRGTSRQTNQLRKLIKLAGRNIDYIDTHWKWGWRNGTWQTWKERTPMEFDFYDKKFALAYDGYSLMDENRSFQELTAKAGHPNIRLAALEWNIAPGPWQKDPQQTPFRTALMQAEILLQLVAANIEVAAFYSLHSTIRAETNNRFVLDTARDFTVNPVADVFRLARHMQGRHLLQAQFSPDGVITMSTEANTIGEYLVYVLNKKDAPVHINIASDTQDRSEYRAFQIVTLTESGLHEKVGQAEAADRITIEPNSLTMIRVRRK